MYQLSLAQILHQYEGNKRGVCAVIGVPLEHVEAMPDFRTLFRSNITVSEADIFFEQIKLKTGKQWMDISSDVTFKTSVKEKDVSTPQGKRFEYTAAFEIPNDKFDSRLKIIRAYDNREWLIIAKERTGIWRLFGSLFRGCEFKAELDTGTIENPAPNSYVCGFLWESSHRAFAVRRFHTSGIVFDIIIVVNTNTSPHITINTNGPVLINTGQGQITPYNIPLGEMTPINFTADGGGLVNVIVSHQGSFNQFGMVRSGQNNQGVISVSGDFPSLLQSLQLKGMQLVELLSPVPAGVNFIDVRDNLMTPEAITDILIQLDDSGVANGTGMFEDQGVTNPYIAGLPAEGLTRKSNLIGKGWTITHDTGS